MVQWPNSISPLSWHPKRQFKWLNWCFSFFLWLFPHYRNSFLFSLLILFLFICLYWNPQQFELNFIGMENVRIWKAHPFRLSWKEMYFEFLFQYCLRNSFVCYGRWGYKIHMQCRTFDFNWRWKLEEKK